MASLSHPTGNWAEDTYEAAAAPSGTNTTAPTAPPAAAAAAVGDGGEDNSEMSLSPPKLPGEATATSAADAAGRTSAGTDQGSEMKDDVS